MNAARIVAAFDEFCNAFPQVRACYATKCNPDKDVLRVLRDAGSGFEVASVAEVRTLASIGVRPADLLFSNPVRARRQTREAALAGVYRFAVDSVEELFRVADEAPGSCVYVRLATGGGDSVVPSEGKFGVDAGTARELLRLARDLSLVPYGVTFHMGSQTLEPAALEGPLADVATLLAGLQRDGIRLEMVDIGGGFPAVYDEPVPSLALFGDVVSKRVAELPYPVEVYAEPGRCLVAEAGTFRCTVIGVARRPNGWFAHTDLGVFNGMMEVLETGGNLRYPVRDSRADERRRAFQVTGPTCDSQDTFARDVPLSEGLREGDVLSVGSTGAYTAAYASQFNGFPLPRVVVV
ncbi:type III PLP-dependent enzyme [Jidongwangia harbinensis]|uniref:type III PLP-dependent enzyme n=1 Tax=Jidongwangia harbinensis TaxID=2878561 RepID=UPI001CD9FADB|nr:type III PLP-dependent enzyme [Jidongwangia harbinensis]MCA2218307.1 type III PLP-dependent enzyme [Jidongwangia harbinensis]